MFCKIAPFGLPQKLVTLEGLEWGSLSRKAAILSFATVGKQLGNAFQLARTAAARIAHPPRQHGGTNRYRSKETVFGDAQWATWHDIRETVGDLGGIVLGEDYNPRKNPKGIANWSLTSLQLKLITIGARVVRHARTITFQLAEVAITGAMVRAILTAIHRLRAPPSCA